MSPDTTGFYGLQNDPDGTPYTFLFSLSSPVAFEIDQNETVTNNENNSFTIPSGSWTVLSSSNVTVTNSGSEVDFQGTLSTPPYGTYSIAGSGPSFDFVVTNQPNPGLFGSAISLNLKGSATAAEPADIAMIGMGLCVASGGFWRRRSAPRRAA